MADGHIDSPTGIPDRNIQPASLDLTLGDIAYRLRCSFLPGTSPVREKLGEYGMDEIDLTDSGAVLEQNRPYLIPLRERLTVAGGDPGANEPKALDRTAGCLHPGDHRQGRTFRRGQNG